MARKEPETYKSDFFKEYGYFLKGRICKDYEFQDQLSKSLYFETSKTMNEELSRVVTHQLATDP
jgi:TNF receptor-associated protein 1